MNGNWTPQEKALHEARLKAKAKRRQRKSSSRNSTSESISESGDLAGGDPHSPKGKVNTNDRKSRTGKGRGLPKKGIVDLHRCMQLPGFFGVFRSCHDLFTVAGKAEQPQALCPAAALRLTETFLQPEKVQSRRGVLILFLMTS